MSSTDIAKDKAARLLKKRGSVSGSSTSNDYNHIRSHRKQSMSTISFIDEPSHEDPSRPPVIMENTYQMAPGKRFPQGQITGIVKDVLEGYLAEEKYEPELCKQMTKTLSEVVKARVKELMIPRYKIICIVHIGQLNSQAVRIGSRCLWESNNDTFASFEYRNPSLFALGTVYGIYTE